LVARRLEPGLELLGLELLAVILVKALQWALPLEPLLVEWGELWPHQL
jgi:hypothetical protein